MNAAEHVAPLDLTPNPARAAALDARMRERLVDSLRYIHSQSGDHLTFPEPAFERLLKRLGEGPVGSSLFAVYYDLVLAIGQDGVVVSRTRECANGYVQRATPSHRLSLPNQYNRTATSKCQVRRISMTSYSRASPGGNGS